MFNLKKRIEMLEEDRFKDLLIMTKMSNAIHELEENQKVNDKMILILWNKLTNKQNGVIGNLYEMPYMDEPLNELTK